MQPNPIGIQGELNTYNYVNSNALNGVDPLGLNTQILRLYDPIGVDHLALRFVNSDSPALIMSIYSDNAPIPFLYAKSNLVFDTDQNFANKYHSNLVNFKLDIIELNTTLGQEQEIRNKMLEIEKNRMFTAIGTEIQCTKSINLSMSNMGFPLLSLNNLSTPASFIENLLKNKEYKKRIIKNETTTYPYFKK